MPEDSKFYAIALHIVHLESKLRALVQYIADKTGQIDTVEFEAYMVQYSDKHKEHIAEEIIKIGKSFQ